MTTSLINGYMVVGLPGAGNYRGVDREPWDIIDAAYYDRDLPSDIQQIYASIKNDPSRGFWWPTVQSRTEAAKLLAFTRTREPQAELIGIVSPYLDRVAGRAGQQDTTLLHLGFDLISVGEWSLLRAMAESATHLPDRTAALINASGLLRRAEDADRVETSYRRMAEQGFVEAIADRGSGLPVEPVGVYLTGEEAPE